MSTEQTYYIKDSIVYTRSFGSFFFGEGDLPLQSVQQVMEQLYLLGIR
jgi:hypothetical protein